MTRNIRLHSRNAFIIVGRVRPVRFEKKFRAAFFPKTNSIPSFQKRELTVGLRGTKPWLLADRERAGAEPRRTTPHRASHLASPRRAMPIRGHAVPRRR